jgi:starch synthase (maltosyl-transferring)
MEIMQPQMLPAPGERARRFVGDRVKFLLRDKLGRPPEPGWRGVLRTNLGRADALRREILGAHTRGILSAGSSWRDIPMVPGPDGWSLELALAETGFFRAKAYLLDPRGWQHWPDGPDFGVSVHPDFYRTGNTLYVAFPRLFGQENAPSTPTEHLAAAVELDRAGYSVIPPSGKLRDLTRQLPHIFDTLGCRILHLLPVCPTPATYARFGRFGSPYATLDLGAVDPALVEFDKRTTGIDQFRELTAAVHSLSGRVVLDIVINHTGWGSNLQENHPEWFLRADSGNFKSPGAWGVTWEDLVELKHDNVELWDTLADVFITWCDRGVDGFRCDAGYMVPVPAWQYIIAKVQQEYPDALFLLEGLGGAWSATEALLTDGGMQWAYSELFQNYSGPEVAHYLDHSLAASDRLGLLVHYSETHDNNRLAEKGTVWSLMRNNLCALASQNGGFGFTCGVEWLAAEKIRVHERTTLNWGASENLLKPLKRLNVLLANHPCFFDGASIQRISPPGSPVLALARECSEAQNHALVFINCDHQHEQVFAFEYGQLRAALPSFPDQTPDGWVNLLENPPAPSPARKTASGALALTLPPGAAYVLAPQPDPIGLSGEAYRAARARAAFAIRALNHVLPVESIGPAQWQDLAALVNTDPEKFLALLNRLDSERASQDLTAALSQAARNDGYGEVVLWTGLDATRVSPVPPGHWLLIREHERFRARMLFPGETPINLESTPAGESHVAFLPPRHKPGRAQLALDRLGSNRTPLTCELLYLNQRPQLDHVHREPRPEDLVLLTNGRGAMARICLDLGRVNSKYDCVLGANLHPDLPVDRHVLAKRIRVWVNADGFISPLNADRLVKFEPGPPARWHFVADAGDGRTVQVQIDARMLTGQNTTVFHFSRPTAAEARGKQLPPDADVRLTIRVDLEDRGFHTETRRNPGADHHFTTHTRTRPDHAEPGTWPGFEFTPAPGRQLKVYCSGSVYHRQEEWCHNIPHPNEASRGQPGAGDAFSPGWFEVPLGKGRSSTLVLSADSTLPSDIDSETSSTSPQGISAGEDPFLKSLETAARAFVVRRGDGATVIAGYPWFLDWGRDTFIAARGLIAAGWLEEVRQIIATFARFEKEGTLPNTIFGEDASNRDTVDAPLWFGVVCEELAKTSGSNLDIFSETVNSHGRTVLDVLESIATHYQSGTPNGIRVDEASGLVWSPSHFTWMDTNYPACTPREGFAVEVQALWIRLLRLLARIGTKSRRADWQALADRAWKSVEDLFWIQDLGYYSDVLQARSREPASHARVDDALRSNCLFLVSLGLARGERARRCVAAASKHLVVPGALRSLAPLPVKLPLLIHDASGRLLVDPNRPYHGRYEGDEDTRRKPAYHNGTAWVWTLPTFCEALAGAWDFSPSAVAAAKAYLGATGQLLTQGCLGQLPEILDGDAPHRQRGCDAQAWSATEVLRVWKALAQS